MAMGSYLSIITLNANGLNAPTERQRDRESTWERIQNNDSENDPKSWNQNGITDKEPGDKDWEDARKV